MVIIFIILSKIKRIIWYAGSGDRRGDLILYSTKEKLSKKEIKPWWFQNEKTTKYCFSSSR